MTSRPLLPPATSPLEARLLADAGVSHDDGERPRCCSAPSGDPIALSSKKQHHHLSPSSPRDAGGTSRARPRVTRRRRNKWFVRAAAALHINALFLMGGALALVYAAISFGPDARISFWRYTCAQFWWAAVSWANIGAMIVFAVPGARGVWIAVSFLSLGAAFWAASWGTLASHEQTNAIANLYPPLVVVGVVFGGTAVWLVVPAVHRCCAGLCAARQDGPGPGDSHLRDSRPRGDGWGWRRLLARKPHVLQPTAPWLLGVDMSVAGTGSVATMTAVGSAGGHTGAHGDRATVDLINDDEETRPTAAAVADGGVAGAAPAPPPFFQGGAQGSGALSLPVPMPPCTTDAVGRKQLLHESRRAASQSLLAHLRLEYAFDCDRGQGDNGARASGAPSGVKAHAFLGVGWPVLRHDSLFGFRLVPGRSRVQQAVVCIMMILSMTCLYLSCESLSRFFFFPARAGCDDAQMSYEKHIAGFAVYVVVFTVFRGPLKICGAAIDMYKIGSCPFYWIGEFIAMCYYYTFYRWIFVSLPPFEIFLGLQVMHCVSEWLLYPFRTTDVYLSRAKRCRDRLPGGYWPKLWFRKVFIPGAGLSGATKDDIIKFVCLDFGLRFVTDAGITFSFVAMVATMAYGPDSTHFCVPTLRRPGAFALVVAYSLGALAIDTVNSAAVEWLFWRRHHKTSMVTGLQNLFASPQWCWFVVLMFPGILMTGMQSRVELTQLQ